MKSNDHFLHSKPFAIACRSPRSLNLFQFGPGIKIKVETKRLEGTSNHLREVQSLRFSLNRGFSPVIKPSANLKLFPTVCP